MTSSAILYRIVGLYPGSLIPLVHFPGPGEEPKVDFLSHSMKVRLLILEHFRLLPGLDVSDLFQLGEIRFIPPMRVTVIEQIREELNSHYKTASFLEINSKLAEEIVVIRDSLVALEEICTLTIKYNYPVRLFQWLLFCRVEFIELVPNLHSGFYIYMHVSVSGTQATYSKTTRIPRSVLPITRF